MTGTKSRLLAQAVVLFALAAGVQAAGDIIWAGDPVFELDTSQLELTDELTSWPNTAGEAYGGYFNTKRGTPSVVEFTDNMSGTTVKVVEMQESAMLWQDEQGGGEMLAVPEEIVQGEDWTMEAWVYRKAQDGESVYFAWGARGGQVSQFCYHSDRSFVAWDGGLTDRWWRDGVLGEMPVQKQFHHIVWTFTGNEDGVFTSYVDGQLNEGPYTGCKNNNPFGDPVSVGDIATSEDGSTWHQQALNGYIAKIRVHDGALSAEDVLHNYNAEKDLYRPPALFMSPSVIDFGIVNFDAVPTDPKEITIENIGDTQIDITTIELTGEGFEYDVEPEPGILPPGETQVFSVMFDPAEQGAKTGSITVEADCTGCAQTVELTGDAERGLLTVMHPLCSVIECGHAAAGETGPVRTVIIRNDGPGSLRISDIAITGQESGEFELIDPDTSPVGSGEKRKFKFALKPSGTGEVTATLDITFAEEPALSYTLRGNVEKIYVGTENAADEPDHGDDPSSPLATIQYAIDNSEPGDVIEVADGTYAAFDFGRTEKNVRLTAENPRAVNIDMTGSVITMGNTTGCCSVTVEGFNIIKTDAVADRVGWTEDFEGTHPDTWNLGMWNVRGDGHKTLTFRDCHLECAEDWNGRMLLGITGVIWDQEAGEWTGHPCGRCDINLIDSEITNKIRRPTYPDTTWPLVVPSAVEFRLSYEEASHAWEGTVNRRLYVDGCSFVDNGGFGMCFLDPRLDVIVKNSHFQHCGDNAVNNWSARSVKVSDSTFINNLRMDIEGYYWAYCDHGWQVDRCFFSKNTAINDETADKRRHDKFMFLNDRSGNKVVSNCLFEGGRFGIDMGKGPGDGINLGEETVQNCTLVGISPGTELGLSSEWGIRIRGIVSPEQAGTHGNIINTICLGFNNNNNSHGNTKLESNILNVQEHGDPFLSFQGGDPWFDAAPRRGEELNQDPGDYRLTSDSTAAIGQGVDVGLEVDFAGEVRDLSIGAFSAVEKVAIYMGDVNGDWQANKPNIADAIYLLNFLFGGGPAPVCAKAADINDDDALDVSDAIKLLAYLFAGGSMTLPDGTEVTPATHPGCAEYLEEQVPEFQAAGLPGCANPCSTK